MAWTRTATSLISFGFGVYKFFEYLHGDPSREGALVPRWFALLMIVIGVVALTLATLQHHRSMKAMRASYAALPRSLSAFVAALIAALGLVGLVAVMFHL
jgi:putative membrane protein